MEPCFHGNGSNDTGIPGLCSVRSRTALRSGCPALEVLLHNRWLQKVPSGQVSRFLQNSLQAGSLGCYDYEGSLMGDEYPNYVNPGGRFLTPTAYR